MSAEYVTDGNKKKLLGFHKVNFLKKDYLYLHFFNITEV